MVRALKSLIIYSPYSSILRLNSLNYVNEITKKKTIHIYSYICLPFSHVVPLNRFVQWQEKSAHLSVQDPPFWHGTDKHSFLSVNTIVIIYKAMKVNTLYPYHPLRLGNIIDLKGILSVCLFYNLHKADEERQYSTSERYFVQPISVVGHVN